MARIVALGTSPSGMSFKFVPFVARVDGEFRLYGMGEEHRVLSDAEFAEMAEKRIVLMVRQTSERWQSSGETALVTSMLDYDWTGVDIELPSRMSVSRFESMIEGEFTSIPMDSLIREPLVAVWLGRHFEAAAVGLNVMDEQVRTRMSFVFAEVESKPNSKLNSKTGQGGAQHGILAIMKYSDAAALLDDWLVLPLAITKQALCAPDISTLPDNTKTVVRQLALLLSNTPTDNAAVLAVRMKAISAGIVPGDVEKELDFQLAVNGPMVRALWQDMLAQSLANIPTVDQVIEMVQEATEREATLTATAESEA